MSSLLHKRDVATLPAGVIDSINVPVGGHRRQLPQRPAAATAYVENREILLDANVHESPVGQLGVGLVHQHGEQATRESVWFTNLTHEITRCP